MEVDESNENKESDTDKPEQKEDDTTTTPIETEEDKNDEPKDEEKKPEDDTADKEDKPEEKKEEKMEVEEPKTEPLPTHLFRVGWSLLNTGLQLGEYEHSYCYESSGKFITNKKFEDYGVKFGVGDVIGSFLVSHLNFFKMVLKDEMKLPSIIV